MHTLSTHQARLWRRCLFIVALIICARVGGASAQPEEEPATANDEAPAPDAFLPPELDRFAEADYPQRGLDERISTTVTVTLFIDAAGHVVKTRVLTPSGYPGYGFEEAAEAALKKFRFKPALQSGEPAPSKLDYEYQFIHPDDFTEDGRPAVGFVFPELLELVEAEYPQKAIEDGWETSIIAVLYVDETGAVVEVEFPDPVEPEGYGFDVAARAALEKFRFKPALSDGKPIPVKVDYRYDFILPELPPEPEVEPEETDPDEPTGPVTLVIELRERGTRREVKRGVVSLQRGDEEPIERDFLGGRFEGQGIGPGEWNVLIDAPGYGVNETNVVVEEGSVTEVSLLVEKKNYDIYDADGEYEGAMVYETRETAMQQEVTVRKLNVAEIQRIPGNQGDALKVVQNLPGVARSTFNNGQIVVRGASPEDTEVLLDGAPIPLLYHFGGLSSVINSDVLSSIDFIPGNFSARYGRAIGGVLDVKTRRPKIDRYTGYLDVSLLAASFLIEGPVTENISFQASARRSYFDAILPLVIPDDAPLSFTAAPRYWDYQVRLNWGSDKKFKGDPVHEVELFSYGSDDILELVLASPAGGSPNIRGDISSGTAFHRGQLTWTYRGDNLKNRLLYNFGNTNVNFALGDSLRFNLLTLQSVLRDELSFDVTDWLGVLVGLDMNISPFDISILAPAPPQEGEVSAGFNDGVIESSLSETQYQPAVFVEFALRPVKPLLISLGARVDYDKAIDKFSGDLRSTARYQIDKYWAIKGGVGSFQQAPEGDESSAAFGNPDLDFKKAMHYALGFETSLPAYDALFFEVTGFYKNLSQLPVSSDALVERNGQQVQERLASVGTGDIYGAEFLIRHNLANDFFGWIAYTISRSERQDGPGEATRLFSTDQTHILTVLGSYKLPNNWQIGLRFRYVTGNPSTPTFRGAYNADLDDYDPLPGAINSERIDAFHQLDLRIDKSWIYDYWIFSLYLDIQNVYLHANPEGVSYNFDYTESANIEGFPILPSIGMRGQF